MDAALPLPNLAAVRLTATFYSRQTAGKVKR
jgi:hypothetical protein